MNMWALTFFHVLFYSAWIKICILVCATDVQDWVWKCGKSTENYCVILYNLQGTLTRHKWLFFIQLVGPFLLNRMLCRYILCSNLHLAFSILLIDAGNTILTVHHHYHYHRNTNIENNLIIKDLTFFTSHMYLKLSNDYKKGFGFISGTFNAHLNWIQYKNSTTALNILARKVNKRGWTWKQCQCEIQSIRFICPRNSNNIPEVSVAIKPKALTQCL